MLFDYSIIALMQTWIPVEKLSWQIEFIAHDANYDHRVKVYQHSFRIYNFCVLNVHTWKAKGARFLTYSYCPNFDRP